ncbi:murein hydrolase activator EnvC family protein [Sphaerisporangium corydalis]|uniref:Murein hydrolase activator EnvC family protein n=1 Tax=Sphaerisporangium corydalis TaxID=1441875 RepID=A0ABV9EQL9_9ACTN|nr:M23 family metallopeptidase [Sphaerisporangium corydalis]
MTDRATPPSSAHGPPGRAAYLPVPPLPTEPDGRSLASKEPKWHLPLDGPPTVLRRFDPPAQPWLPGHRGVDLLARPRQEVKAAGSGVVGYAGPLAGRGVVMIVHPDGLRTTYLPVHASVRRGQPVEGGALIGSVEEATGHCPTSCLHWGLINENRYLDALLLLGLGQVRLLPRWPISETSRPQTADPPGS